MADNTKIEWADATANFWIGCTKLSPACDHCYAERDWDHRKHRVTWGPHGDRSPVKAGADVMRKMQRRAAAFKSEHGRPPRVFINSLSDFADNHRSIDPAWREAVWQAARDCPDVVLMILTKRPQNLPYYLPSDWGQGYLNVWIGTTVENQVEADRRIPDLLATPAAVRFLSCEPLLGPVDLRWIAEPDEDKDGVIDALLGCNWIDGSVYDRGEEFRPVRPGHEGRVMRRWVCSPEADILANRKLDWIIVGGESGPGARPMHPDWARSLRDQCQAAGVAFHFKQWGEWGPDTGPLDDCYPNSTIRRDPIMEGDARCAVLVDGAWQHFESGYGAPIELCSGPGDFVYRLGKRRNGRLLDGREWNEVPHA